MLQDGTSARPLLERPSDPVRAADHGFGTLLHRYRKRAALSCLELGAGAHITGSYVSRLEAGDRPPPRRAIVLRLARALGLEDAEVDRLVLLAGYAPPWLVALARVARVTAPHREETAS